jgi:hypothetical protein
MSLTNTKNLDLQKYNHCKELEGVRSSWSVFDWFLDIYVKEKIEGAGLKIARYWAIFNQ